MFTLLLASAAALSGLVSAQNSTYSTSGPLMIDPNSVDLDLRKSWCTGQKNNCWKICGGADAQLGDAFPNECDANDLTYTCTCTNGNQPNISAYQDTLPFYICQQWVIDCTAAHPNDLSGQTACQSVQCGTRNASAAQANSDNSGSSGSSGSASASMPSETASQTSGGGSSGGSGSQSSSGAAASQTGNAAAVVGMNYGTGMLVAGGLAVFGLAL